jgi:hypothetical protein
MKRITIRNATPAIVKNRENYYSEKYLKHPKSAFFSTKISLASVLMLSPVTIGKEALPDTTKDLKMNFKKFKNTYFQQLK